jgi:hypothetical protein
MEIDKPADFSPAPAQTKRVAFAPSPESAPPPAMTTPPQPAKEKKLTKTQASQHRNVPGSAAAVAAKVNGPPSYALAAAKAAKETTSDFLADPNTRTMSHGKKKKATAPTAVQAAEAKTLATHTRLTLHFTGVKPEAGAVSTASCQRLYRATVEALSLNTSARASGAARLETINGTTNGNLSLAWRANVKIQDIMPHAQVIEKCARLEFGAQGRLESPEAWTRFVVESLETSDEDGLIDVRRIAGPVLQSVVFDGMPQKVMEGPTWMCARDRPVPRTASAQFAVLDPQGRIRERFLEYARADGKIDVSYGGVMRKARLFHVKELFSQCTRCWMMGHVNGAAACKAKKNLCQRCALPHALKDHDKLCAKCATLMKTRCDCPDKCVNCRGAHASNDTACSKRLLYRAKPKANAGPRDPNWGDPVGRRAPSPEMDLEKLAEMAGLNGLHRQEERTSAVPSIHVEGVSASIHAPNRNGPAVHVTPEVQARAEAAAEAMCKAEVLRGAEGAAPAAPSDVKMKEGAPAPKPRLLMVTHNGRLIRRGEAIWVGSQDPATATDALMQSRLQAFRDLSNDQEVMTIEQAQEIMSQESILRLQSGLRGEDHPTPIPHAPSVASTQYSCHGRLYSARATSRGICQTRLMQRRICAQSQKLIGL